MLAGARLGFYFDRLLSTIKMYTSFMISATIWREGHIIAVHQVG